MDVSDNEWWQRTACTTGGGLTHAVLELPGGFRLLWVVAEWLTHDGAVSRPACGGASLIGVTQAHTQLAVGDICDGYA